MNNLQKPPFFIIGCVRSGTTFLRNVLRKHPNLVCPEETHFFRWSDAFGTPTSLAVLSNNPTLKKHREIDNISEQQFKKILQQSTSRSDLQRKYMNVYMRQNEFSTKRWFDKTPQNVYGSAMIANEFPGAKFIHIVRNPLNVVSSLRVGNVVKIESIVGACNIWNEAAAVIFTLKRAYPSRVYEVKYEDLTANFLPELEKILAFVGEDFDPKYFNDIVTDTKEHEHNYLFKQEEIAKIKTLCDKWAKHYGYWENSGIDKTNKTSFLLPSITPSKSPFVFEFKKQAIKLENSGAFFTYGFDKEHFLFTSLLTSLPQKTITVKNCFVSKYERTDSPRIRGALYKNGQIIEDATRRGLLGNDDPITVAADRIQSAHKVTGQCVYLGWLSWHFGHLLLEMVARFWVLNSIDIKNVTFIFHPLSHHPVPPEKLLAAKLVQAICDCFGISTQQIIVANQDLLVDELIIPTQLFFLNLTIDNYQYSIYQKIKTYLLQHAENKSFTLTNTVQKQRKVYFSRSQLNDGKRKATNEAAIEKTFQKYGFEIIFPEQLSLSKQIELLDNVSLLAGCDGSALHLAVFLPPKAKLIVLTARNISGNQLLMSSLSNIETHFVCAYTGNSAIGLGDAWNADILQIKKILAEIM